MKTIQDLNEKKWYLNEKKWYRFLKVLASFPIWLGAYSFFDLVIFRINDVVGNIMVFLIFSLAIIVIIEFFKRAIYYIFLWKVFPHKK